MRINNNHLNLNNNVAFNVNDTLTNIRHNRDYAEKEIALSFEDMMSDGFMVIMDNQIKEVLSKIEKQKDKLVKECSILEFRKYKGLISEFIQIINNKSQLKEQIFFDSQGRQKVLKNIESIDIKIDELQKEFLKDNKNNMKIINLAEDVRGLVIDTII